MRGLNSDRVKAKILIEPPVNENGVQMSDKEFSQKVINIANSFGNNPNIGYFLLPQNETQGNCNTSSSTILHKAGVLNEKIREIRDKIPGFVTGFGDYKPWTIQEQNKAVERQKLENYKLSF